MALGRKTNKFILFFSRFFHNFAPQIGIVYAFYNTFYKDRADGTRFVQPATATEYCDRTKSFPYKIDEQNLCLRLFTEAGFETSFVALS